VAELSAKAFSNFKNVSPMAIELHNFGIKINLYQKKH
jgi:hypothetical protein